MVCIEATKTFEKNFLLILVYLTEINELMSNYTVTWLKF